MKAPLGHRSLAAIAMAFAMAVTSSALAGPGGGTTTSTSGAGGTTSGAGAGTGTSSINPDCTVSIQSQQGTTCMQCMGACTNAGVGFAFVCNYDANTQIWCNGPPREMSPSIGCALGRDPAATAPWAFGALAAMAALAVRRRRRT
jgi:MYXO-CTERM domain-containing protein